MLRSIRRKLNVTLSEDCMVCKVLKLCNGNAQACQEGKDGAYLFRDLYGRSSFSQYNMANTFFSTSWVIEIFDL